jgi:hypothetical protein
MPSPATPRPSCRVVAPLITPTFAPRLLSPLLPTRLLVVARLLSSIVAHQQRRPHLLQCLFRRFSFFSFARCSSVFYYYYLISAARPRPRASSLSYNQKRRSLTLDSTVVVRVVFIIIVEIQATATNICFVFGALAFATDQSQAKTAVATSERIVWWIGDGCHSCRQRRRHRCCHRRRRRRRRTGTHTRARIRSIV